VHIDARETVYSGLKKLHGIKVETVFLPNWISTVFGPVLARQNNRGTSALSGLNRFIILIQASLPLHERDFPHVGIGQHMHSSQK
jgi:hypothetical protein